MTADEREIELSQQAAEALDRWTELERLYGDALPQTTNVRPGKKSRGFLHADQHASEIAALDEERQAAERSYQKAVSELQAYRSRAKPPG